MNSTAIASLAYVLTWTTPGTHTPLYFAYSHPIGIVKYISSSRVDYWYQGILGIKHLMAHITDNLVGDHYISALHKNWLLCVDLFVEEHEHQMVLVDICHNMCDVCANLQPPNYK